MKMTITLLLMSLIVSTVLYADSRIDESESNARTLFDFASDSSAQQWINVNDGVMGGVSDEFLRFSVARGNDLMTPIPEFGFPGLKAGDRWCLCVQRWKEALQAEVAPPIFLPATHISALEFVELEDLQSHSPDARQ